MSKGAFNFFAPCVGCLLPCFTTTIKMTQELVMEPGMLNRKLFVCDFWSSILTSLYSKHRNLGSKYGIKIPDGILLGMEDEEVKERLIISGRKKRRLLSLLLALIR